MENEKQPRAIRHYNLLELLGDGSFSKVYKAFNTQDKKIYACKVFPKANLDDEVDTEHFQREINVMALMKHPNIVALHDFFWDDVNFYMILDYCSGGELFDFIVMNDKLSEPVAAYLFRQISSAVHFFHTRGVAHRDIKPENILVAEFPNIKISDFGLCGYVQAKDLMDSFCGSPCYCAPECICRKKYDGRKADIWSLGIVLYAMVTGEHPWDVMNTPVMLNQIVTGSYDIPEFVSDNCADLISKMLVVDSKSRFTIDEVVNHPWINLADQAPFPKVYAASKLPKLEENIKLEDISNTMMSSSKVVESGIKSPLEFIKGSTFSGMKQLSPSLNNIHVKNTSLNKLNAIERRKPVIGQSSLYGKRRRSMFIAVQ